MDNPKNNFLRAKALCGSDLPWCQDDPDDLGPVMLKFLYDMESYRRRWAQRWYENFQFVFGNSTVKWSRRFDFAVDTDFMRPHASINQRASTQISKVVLESLAAMIYAQLPTWLAETADESYNQGRRFASIYEKILDAYMTRLNCDKSFAIASLAYSGFGQVAAYIGWNRGAGKVMQIPQWRKVMAPVFTDYMANNLITGGLLEVPTPAMGSQGQPLFESRLEPVTDESGKQIIKKMMAGDVSMDILTPFEYARDIGSQGMHKTRFVQRVRLMDYDEYLEMVKDLPGATKYAYDVAPLRSDRTMYAYALRHFMRMQFTTPPTISEGMGWKRTENVMKGGWFRHKVLVVEHFDKPKAEMWDEGRRVIVVNGKCTHVTTPDYKTNKEDGWHPIVEAQWMPLPPSSLSIGPLDGVTAKNRELNVADSLIATAMRRVMGGTMLVRMNSGLDPNKLTGEPGQVHLVNDPNNAAVFVNDPMPINPALPQIREQIKSDVYETSGAMDAIRGDRSKNVSSGYALKQIEEREQKRLTPVRTAWEQFVSGCGEKIVACLKANVIELDDAVFGYLKRSAAGQFQSDDIIAFLSTPVDYGVDIKVEAGSMSFKSKATKQADLIELAKNPIIQMRLQNPQVMDNFLKYFDAEKLLDSSSKHRERANRENQVFADYARLGPTASGMKTPVVVFEDDDDIHLAVHGDDFIENSDEILSNENYLRSFLLHMEQHRIQKQEKSGQALPGTAIALPQMYAQARQMPPPQPVPTIFLDAQQRQAMEQQKQIQNMQQPQSMAASGQARPAQAPRTPKPMGQPGAAPQNPSAPSQNTQTATPQGGGQ